MLTKFISFANNIPAIVAEINATRPKIKIAIVSNCKNTLPGIVDPTANPRIITTIFINSFCAVLLNLSTTPHSLNKLPNIKIPTNGDALGTRMLITTVHIIGNKILALFDTSFFAGGITICLSF